MRNFNLTRFQEDFQEIEKQEGSVGSKKLLKKYGKLLNNIKDFYFEYA